MKKIFLIITVISILFLIGCEKIKNSNQNIIENQESEIEINTNIKDDGEGIKENEDLLQFVSIQDLLKEDGINIDELKDGEEHTIKIESVAIGQKILELKVQVKKEKNIDFNIMINENLIFENWCDHSSTGIAIYKDYLVCTGSYDFSGGTAVIFNNDGEKVYEFDVGTDRLRVEDDYIYYSIDYGQSIDESTPGIGAYARTDYILKEENGIFESELKNVDYNDISYSSQT